MKRIVRAIAMLAALLVVCPATAADVRVAVAANFTDPARAIAAAFTRATGDHAILSFGASGTFAAQIERGAPFDLFLSADADRPAALERAGMGVAGSRFTYAVGRLVLYSTRAGVDVQNGRVLRTRGFERLAIADPAAAPYGRAAVQVMERLGVLQAVRPRLVQGSSIAQAYRFVASGAADVGFVAAAEVADKPGGARWLVPAALHAPIAQQAILLRQGAANPAATGFLRFLKGPAARAIIRRYGYAVN